MKRALLSGQNFGPLMILYFEIGGHVLTLFFGMSHGELIGSQKNIVSN